MLYELINSWANPLEKSDSLKSLSATPRVSMDIATDLLRAENVGKKQLEKFMAERVESNVSFYAPIQKKKNEIIRRTSISEKSKGHSKIIQRSPLI